MARGVEWVALATSIPDNEKMLELQGAGDWRAIVTYCYSLAYCGRTMSDGFIPKAALARICGTTKVAHALVNVGLWKYSADGKGWIIPDWAEYQVTSEKFLQRQEAGKKGAEARWSH